MSVGAPIVVSVDDKDYKFPRLRLKELAELTEQYRAVGREELLKTLSDSGVESDAKLKALSEFDQKGPSVRILLNASTTHNGIRDILLKSMQLARAETTMHDIDGLPISADELGWTAYECIGYERPSKEDLANVTAKAEPGPDPTKSEIGS